MPDRRGLALDFWGLGSEWLNSPPLCGAEVLLALVAQALDLALAQAMGRFALFCQQDLSQFLKTQPRAWSVFFLLNLGSWNLPYV